MADFKISINDPKTGKSYKKELNGEAIIGMRIGDKVKGEMLDLPGYEFEIKGGSDSCGFPMRKDVATDRKKVLTVEGVGVKKKDDGIKQRKTVCGNKINDRIVQVNLSIIKYGKQKLDEPAAEEKPEEK